MSYILIAQEAHTLPFVVSVDEETVEQALAKAASMEEGRNILQFTFIVDLKTEEVSRVSRDSDGGWVASDTAFDANIGIETTDEYFQEPQTAEMIE
jgi:hypothetical protein